MEKKYAKALLDLISRGATPVQAVKAVHQELESRGRTKLWKKISYAVAEFGMKASRAQQAKLIVAKESDVRTAKKEALELSGELKNLEVETDTSIIGGWKLETQGSVIDRTYKTALLDIYKQITA